MKSIRRSLIMTAALALFALPAPAQQGGQRGPAGRPPTEEQREEVRIKMEAIKISRLTEELKLGEKTAAAFIPAITSLDRQRRSIMRDNRQAMQELRTELSTQRPDEGKMKAIISRIEKNHNEITALRKKELEAARTNLSVEQHARYILFHQKFQQEMRGMVEGARHPRRGGPGKGGGPAPQNP